MGDNCRFLFHRITILLLLLAVMWWPAFFLTRDSPPIIGDFLRYSLMRIGVVAFMSFYLAQGILLIRFTLIPLARLGQSWNPAPRVLPGRPQSPSGRDLVRRVKVFASHRNYVVRRVFILRNRYIRAFFYGVITVIGLRLAVAMLPFSKHFDWPWNVCAAVVLGVANALFAIPGNDGEAAAATAEGQNPGSRTHGDKSGY